MIKNMLLLVTLHDQILSAFMTLGCSNGQSGHRVSVLGHGDDNKTPEGTYPVSEKSCLQVALLVVKRHESNLE